MSYEDFTDGWTENDPAGAGSTTGDIQWTANHLDFKAYRNKDSNFYKDKGAGHFGDFEHWIDFKHVAKGSTVYAWQILWMLSNDVDDVKGLNDASKTLIAIYGVVQAVGGKTTIKILEAYSGSFYASGTGYDVTKGTTVYLKIIKSGTSLTCKVYTSAANRISDTGATTLSLTLQADHQTRYVFVANTYNDNTNTNKWGDCDIENLDLKEAAGLSIPVAMHHYNRINKIVRG